METRMTSPEQPVIADVRQQAVRGGTVLMAARILVQVFTNCVTILIMRYLTPYDYGVLTNSAIFTGLADLLAEAGVGKALVQRRQLTGGDLDEGFTVSFVLSGIMFGILCGLSRPLAAFFQCPELTRFLPVAGLALLLTPFRTTPLAVLEYRLRMKSLAIITIAISVLQSLLTLGFAMSGFGYWSALGGILPSRLLEAIVLARLARWSPHLRRPSTRGGSLVRFSSQLVGGTLLWYFYSNSDFAVLGRLAGPFALGAYSLAFMLVSMPLQRISANLNQVAYPVYCRIAHDRARLRNWFLRLMALLGVVGIPMLLGMVLVSRDGIVLVLGAKWEAAVVPFQILSLAGTVMILGTAFPPLFAAMGRPDVSLKYNFFCCLVYPASFYIMGSRYGATGIALSWGVLHPLIFVGWITLTRGITSISIPNILFVLRPVLVGGLMMSLCVLFVQHLLWGNAWALPRLVSSIITGALVYSGVIWLSARNTIIADIGVMWREIKGNKETVVK